MHRFIVAILVAAAAICSSAHDVVLAQTATTPNVVPRHEAPYKRSSGSLSCGFKPGGVVFSLWPNAWEDGKARSLSLAGRCGAFIDAVGEDQRACSRAGPTRPSVRPAQMGDALVGLGARHVAVHLDQQDSNPRPRQWWHRLLNQVHTVGGDQHCLGPALVLLATKVPGR
jgi:hypothetical protein